MFGFLRLMAACAAMRFSMFTVAIVENEKADAHLMKDYLKKYAGELKIPMEVRIYYSGQAFLDAYQPDFSLILMDIEMPVKSGMETAQEFRAFDRGTPLVFVTNIAKYAIQGYSVGAMDYILKPVRYADLKIRLERIRERNGFSSEQIIFSYQSQHYIFQPSEVYYVESFSHAIVFHTKKGDYPARKSMNDWEKALKTFGFSRCSNSYLVNLRLISEIRGNSILIDEKEIPLSRARKKTFLQEWMLYV